MMSGLFVIALSFYSELFSVIILCPRVNFACKNKLIHFISKYAKEVVDGAQLVFFYHYNKNCEDEKGKLVGGKK